MHENRETSMASERPPVPDRPEQAQSRTAGMHAREESDSGTVPMNQPNKGGQPLTEAGEGRPGINENIAPSSTRSTQSGESVSQGLRGVRQRARDNKQEQFTARLHHLTIDLLRESYFALQRQAAPGVDGTTWKQYGETREDRLTSLHSEIHRGTYRARPSRRV
jgi:RNA-directed DNA polymerase